MNDNSMENEFISTLKQREYYNDCTNLDGLSELLSKQFISVYIGFDCTAQSLHVGSLMQIMILRKLQQFGHTPIILLGGGTTKIGDPSGKDEARKLLSSEEIERNKAGILNVIAKFIDISKVIVVDNSVWLDKLDYLTFLREIGRHFSVNRMLSFESVKLRLDRQQNLSFLEFNYMLLQAYDYVELNKKYGCKLQIGGSDQWGNIICGIDLARRLGMEELFGLTTPLITTSSGKKMGKSESGAIWLSENLLSAYDYWQFWRNTEDDDVIKFLKLFTEVDVIEIEKFAKLKGKDLNDAKIALANEATALCHGAKAAKDAYQAALKTFSIGGNECSDMLPSYDVSRGTLEMGLPAYKLFAESGICESGGEAKRLIKQGGAKLNDTNFTDPMLSLNVNDFIDNKLKISAGKKKHMVINLKA